MCGWNTITMEVIKKNDESLDIPRMIVRITLQSSFKHIIAVIVSGSMLPDL